MLNQEVAHKFIAPDFKLQVSHIPISVIMTMVKTI